MSRHVLFQRGGTLYAIEADAVAEITEVAWLSPWPGRPEIALGLIDYRGRPVPVIDLQRRLGGPPSQPCVTDQLLFFTMDDGGMAALLIDHAEDLRSLEGCVHPLSQQDRAGMWSQQEAFVTATATLEERIAVVLDRSAFGGLRIALGEGTERANFFSAAPSEARGLLQERARALAAAPDELSLDATIQVVVFRWGEEVFGIDVSEVAELTPCPNVTRVPGAPRYLLGLVYHRGSLLRLVDIREQLGLNPGSGPYRPAEIVVLNGSGILTGIGVDAIETVASIEAARLHPHASGQTSLPSRGSTPYGSGWLTLVDPSRLAVSVR